MRILILFLILIIFQSCSSQAYIKKRDFRLSNNHEFHNESSIIIVRIASQSVSTGVLKNRYGNGFTEMNWCKENEKFDCKEILYFSPFANKKTYGQYLYYKIIPGKYYLNKIKEKQDYFDNLFLLPFKFLADIGTYGALKEPNFNTSPSGWNKKLGMPNFASFEARPGEIVYIGDLRFTFTKQKYWLKGKIDLEIEDKYSDAIKYFFEEYPEFRDKKITKRLIRSGVFLNDYDAGFFW
jgi:hypothetical protein